MSVKTKMAAFRRGEENVMDSEVNFISVSATFTVFCCWVVLTVFFPYIESEEIHQLSYSHVYSLYLSQYWDRMSHKHEMAMWMCDSRGVTGHVEAGCRGTIEFAVS